MKYTITSRFGQTEGFRSHGHSGIDFQMGDGTQLRSIKEGTIYKIVDYGHKNAGKTIEVQWDDGKVAIYGHLSKFSNWKVGQHVNKGDLLGYSGHSGNVYSSSGGNGAHLHFGLKENGHFINPSPYTSDIQHMNDKIEHINNFTNQLATNNFKFSDLINGQMNIYSDLLHNFKLNFISIINSIDYSMVIQHFENLFNFFFS